MSVTDQSSSLEKAQTMLKAAKGKKYSSQQRCEQAIQLAELMLIQAQGELRPDESRLLAELSRMIEDPKGKTFTTRLTDQCFRSRKTQRVADQLLFLLDQYGTPRFIEGPRRLQLKLFRVVGKLVGPLLVPLIWRLVRRQTARVIIPGETRPLLRHMALRRQQGVRVNLNRLGEAILGEGEAQRRTDLYLEDLARPEVEYISIKVSTICSQINLVGWNDTVDAIASRLRILYRAAAEHRYCRPDGTEVPKFVNLDMEEYRDLGLTVAVFKKVLEEPEFRQHTAGLVLQSYLPDSYVIQQELTVWAMERVAAGGAPVKIRLVKGANLAMEQVEASLHGWPQAPYISKELVDANFRRMLLYACEKPHAQAVKVGVASHNLFDIAYAMILREERELHGLVEFEMLEGMAEYMRRAVQNLTGEMLLYCPVARAEEFQNAVAYLVRRLDENTAPQNFLRHIFDLQPGSESWKHLVEQFRRGFQLLEGLPVTPRRQQNRFDTGHAYGSCCPFENEADTDFTLTANQHWAKALRDEWHEKSDILVPAVIAGKELSPKGNAGVGVDPSRPGYPLYRYHQATSVEIKAALACAKDAAEGWSTIPVAKRNRFLAEAANTLRERRADLIGAMIADGGKTVMEADVEVSEAIDFIEYYRRSVDEWMSLEDVTWKPKGVALVAPPWNFPCAIPVGGIVAALAAGNSVIFKPAPEAVLVGWQLVQALWKAGISKQMLQFVPCQDDPEGSMLIQDPRVSLVVLTGATSTAEKFLQMRPGLDLLAETGGKNSIIVTGMADRDIAVRDIVQSAFGHAGQKCSACSLAVLEGEVYDDVHFRQQLADAAASLPVRSAWDPFTRVTPMIHPPADKLLRALTQLEPGESWLLEPRQDPDNPALWRPGIKLGVTQGGYTHTTEFFGPVLGLIRARDLDHAIQIANGTSYGLTSGLHSLDRREQVRWQQQIEAGNLYINRGITGAIVQRQPFGGCKDSSFGRGIKAGGPNYMAQFMVPRQRTMPEEIADIPNDVMALAKGLRGTDMALWSGSVGSYCFYWQHYFSKDHDPSKLIGQDNLFSYRPHAKTVLRMLDGDKPVDVRRVCAAAQLVGAPLELSATMDQLDAMGYLDWKKEITCVTVVAEDLDTFITKLPQRKDLRLRVLQQPVPALANAAAQAAARLIVEPILANGRLELLNFLREVSVSHDYHRYGNLGIREGEKRKPLVGGEKKCCKK